MFHEPIDLTVLKMKKFALIDKIDSQVADKALLAEIKQLLGVNFSLSSFFRNALGISTLLKSYELNKLRNRLALESPDALETFDELISVIREYDKKNRPLVVFKAFG